jgi:hypothetical protein
VTESAHVGILHVHSEYSHDSRDSVESLRRSALERGIGFVGLTDHAEDLDADDYHELRRDCETHSDERVRIFPGLEFRFPGYKGLHLLALNLREWIAPASPAEFVAMTRGKADLTISAHPVLYRYRMPDAVREGIDAVEVWNTGYNTRYLPDPRAIRLLTDLRRSRPEVVAIAGLDQHRSENDRGARVLLHHYEAEPLVAIRAGRFTNRGVTMELDAHASLGAIQLGGLSVARTMLDLVNAVHERVMRRFKS